MTSPCTLVERKAERHDLVFVNLRGWQAMFAGRPYLAGEPLTARWPEEGWPAIRRRPRPDEPSGLALGVPLPPSAGKKRLCLLLQSDDVLSVARPPSLHDACAAAPSAWRPTINRLRDLASRQAVEARVFGSIAWCLLTGLDYLTATSDLDLVLDIGRDTNLDRLSDELAAIEADAPMRVDGELRRDDGAAVNWRELHAGADQVLVKHIDGVALLDRCDFISGRPVS